jgi:ABC-type glycerol-3-phosphate transport system substrate-binding protein
VQRRDDAEIESADLIRSVRKAIEDQVQAILSGKTTPAQAVQAAQKNADELLRPYVEETALKRLE